MTATSSISLSARITLDLHSLNNEGTEGNQQQTRMVHIVDAAGKRHVVNAISGDMMKHILVGHLTPLLAAAGQPLSQHAKELHPDRILPDKGFKDFVKGNTKGNSAILRYMVEKCAVTDIAGTLFAEKAVARKSCVEFGWVVGVPGQTVTEQYFHVKYDPQSREKAAGGEDVEGRQAIFHRPASSGIYALVCTLDLYRIGLNDITREYDVKQDDRTKRARALVQALAATLVEPKGAQRNTQSPHVVGCEGIVTESMSSLPAPMLSPLNPDYRAQVEGIANALNGLRPDTATVTVRRFETLADAARELLAVSSALTTPDDA